MLRFPRLKKRFEKSRASGAGRSSLKNPAQDFLALFRRQGQIAVLEVRCHPPENLFLIYAYLVEPAFRGGCTLLVHADLDLAQLQALNHHDFHWRYPWAAERLLHLARLGQQSYAICVPRSVNRWQHLWLKLTRQLPSSPDPAKPSRLDPEQNGAVQAGDGVVQIIAPAGSGKTTVLIERVKELQKRGTAAERILCMSFNRDAKVEIGERLIRAGVVGVEVRSFHGMSLAILKAENRLRAGIGTVEDEVLEKLIEMAGAEESTPDNEVEPQANISVTDARNALCDFKLAAMITSEEALAKAQNGDPSERLAARIFHLYQQELARRDLLDFDDLIAGAVALLQTDAEVRARWQNRFDRVLVDEYQDIEPSQALLVGILAAPQDSLFCVGDEDQCIYAWRRATVRRIIELDQVYPGLERHALIRNYRCGRKITDASRRLIEHNKIRFRKPLKAAAKVKGDIVVASCSSRQEGAELVAYLISDAQRQEVAVLARTSRLLGEIKDAFGNRYGRQPEVELATIHAAKGREWNRVILFAVDEGQTPHAQALAEDGLEDERRLFYVAMTRAKMRLEIVCTRGRESRFLQEAGLPRGKSSS